ncbi:MAG: patatin-like phospholipase family protein [Trueperaceae bacterium]|nr:patatin-like phospholipase family protein [Trueperaceae bacterium]
MTDKKRINLALQGGGAHGAFAWGVLEHLLDDGRLSVDGICATSAGTMNAVCFAHGLAHGGPDQAKATLTKFWRRVATIGQRYSGRAPWDTWPWAFPLLENLRYIAFESATRVVSPYQFNPFGINPLRDLLDDLVDFETLRDAPAVKLFISTTKVRTGRARVFHTDEISLDVAMASACLPYLFKAVEIGGDYYWDGGYTGNPALFPLHYHTDTQDLLIVHFNPIERDSVPTTADAISDRINEISFNSSLLHELRSIAFVQELIDQDMLKDDARDRFKYLYVHALRADRALSEYSIASKFAADWGFFTHLRDKGRAAMAQWLRDNFAALGERSTVDLHQGVLLSAENR